MGAAGAVAEPHPAANATMAKPAKPRLMPIAHPLEGVFVAWVDLPARHVGVDVDGAVPEEVVDEVWLRPPDSLACELPALSARRLHLLHMV